MMDAMPAPTLLVSAAQKREAVEAENNARLGALNAQGQVVGGIDEHYLVALLEEMLGADGIERARMAQQVWLSGELDRIESEVRRRRLTAPLQGAQ